MGARDRGAVGQPGFDLPLDVMEPQAPANLLEDDATTIRDMRGFAAPRSCAAMRSSPWRETVTNSLCVAAAGHTRASRSLTPS